MLNSYVLVSPYFEEEDEIEVDGQIIRGRKVGDLVVSIGQKPKYLTGILQHIGRGIGEDVRDLTPGSLVIFRPSSEFRNVIEGVDFYLMKQFDLICSYLSETEIAAAKKMAREHGVTIEFNERIPVGDYVMLKPDVQPITKTSTTHVYNPNAATQNFKAGDLFVFDTAFSQEKKKKILRYGIGTVALSGELSKKDFTGKKVAYELSSYYIWVEEFGVAFIRYGDVLGTIDDIDPDTRAT